MREQSASILSAREIDLEAIWRETIWKIVLIEMKSIIGIAIGIRGRIEHLWLMMTLVALRNRQTVTLCV